MGSVRHRFQVLEAQVRLSGPEEIVGPIAAAYARFRVAAPATSPVAADPPGAAVQVSLVSGDRPTVNTDGRIRPLVPGYDATLQVYQRFLEGLLDRIGSHAILHSAALVAPDGGAFLIAAPRGHGKSTLTLELVSRGFRFLSDDYAPLALGDQEISPYPRAVGLRPDASAPLPQAVQRARSDPSNTQLLGKTLLDVGKLFGEDALATSPAPLRHVILLTAGSPDKDPLDDITSLDVVARSEAQEQITDRLQQIAGVEIAGARPFRGLYHWHLVTRPAQRSTEQLARVLEDEAIVFSEKHWGGRPDFTSVPREARVKRRTAAALLGREMLNRRTRGRLLARYDGNVTRMFLDLAEALRGAECWQVSVGRHRETAAVIDKLVRS